MLKLHKMVNFGNYAIKIRHARNFFGSSFIN